MRERMIVRMIAAQIPAELRQMRARMMLESEHEFLGVDEVPCPACAGSGWLSRRLLERCPVCCGFRQVPVGLADWYRSRKTAYHDDTTSTTDGQELAYQMDESPSLAEPDTMPAVLSSAEPSA